MDPLGPPPRLPIFGSFQLLLRLLKKLLLPPCFRSPSCSSSLSADLSKLILLGIAPVLAWSRAVVEPPADPVPTLAEELLLLPGLVGGAASVLPALPSWLLALGVRD